MPIIHTHRQMRHSIYRTIIQQLVLGCPSNNIRKSNEYDCSGGFCYWGERRRRTHKYEFIGGLEMVGGEVDEEDGEGGF